MSSIFPGDLWGVGEAQVNGLPLVVRFRSGLPPVPVRQANENLVIIAWPYQGIETGMPDEDTKPHMNRFEEAIEQSFEHSAIGVLVASLTGNHRKEWRIYTADVDAFLNAFNECLAGHPAYPLELNVFNDPDWNGLSAMQPQGSDQLH